MVLKILPPCASIVPLISTSKTVRTSRKVCRSL